MSDMTASLVLILICLLIDGYRQRKEMKWSDDMADREKVVKELEFCLNVGKCTVCEYSKGRMFATCRHIIEDAEELLKEQEHKDRMFHALEDDWKRLKELLKEQEAVKPKSRARHGANPQIRFFCGKCNAVLYHHRQKYCMECGRKVKW